MFREPFVEILCLTFAEPASLLATECVQAFRQAEHELCGGHFQDFTQFGFCRFGITQQEK